MLDALSIQGLNSLATNHPRGDHLRNAKSIDSTSTVTGQERIYAALGFTERKCFSVPNGRISIA